MPYSILTHRIPTEHLNLCVEPPYCTSHGGLAVTFRRLISAMIVLLHFLSWLAKTSCIYQDRNRETMNKKKKKKIQHVDLMYWHSCTCRCFSDSILYKSNILSLKLTRMGGKVHPRIRSLSIFYKKRTRCPTVGWFPAGDHLFHAACPRL